ncbi:aryl hydrocarbon receptor 1b [Danio rerio]|uniref:Aryl hydrocarbon receptor n=2 Tax=Danio rerio TaxID=7955 RepID=Q4U3K9_DANRE|nr:aryl hydrocarbon receptor 1b [Danio rerio]AAY42958.1 aryl hydrocarbon receptor 1B [Danio rerio]|eukprot:NP_001019987.1 aryl hydrocarbon receptor [Danio rerio]
MYAGRKRRKPVQRTVKQPPAEGVKSNPSKRHRDRLNSELDRLSSLLPFPEEVTSSLDKLSILRLSVSYLRAKNFFSVTLKNHNCNGLSSNNSNHDNSKATGLVDGCLREGELLLQALNGFVLVVTAEGIIFYCSHTIQDYLGFHQTDVMHQNVFELIHTEDQQAFRRNLHWALNPPPASTQTEDSSEDGDPAPNMSLVLCNPDQLPPENSSFLERNFVCRFRCLLDNSSGFLALNFQGRLKFLHGQNRRLDDGGQMPPQLALFAIATPLQPPSIMEIRTKNMIFRTKHKLDFTPMACDAKGKIVLGYTEAELRVRGSGYQFIHAADMLYCAENHVRMIKTGESGLTVFRLLTKDNRWKWVQANARLVYKNGKPDYIIATQRPLVEEEGGEHLRKRSMHLPFTFATGEALLYQINYPMLGFPDTLQDKGKNNKTKKSKVNKSSKDDLDPSSLLGAMMRQDESVYVCQPAMEPRMSFHSSLFGEQGETSTFSSSAENESWNPVQNGVTTASKQETSSFDPLLATLDSLSLENEESCSNSELFSALENLGLNAEDLELLLLDERMIQVEVEPDFIPSLNDLLTNNEILSYVHDSLENQTEDPAESQKPSTALDSVENSKPESDSPPQVTSSVPAPFWPQKQIPPILHLSQRMQQHLNGQSVCHKTENWIHTPLSQVPTTESETANFNQHDTTLVNSVPVVHNGHWVPEHTQVNLNSQLSDKITGTSKAQPQQWQQNQLPVPFQCKPKTIEGGDTLANGIYSNPQWHGYNFAEQLVTNGPCFPNGQMAHTQTMGTHIIDYNMTDNSGVEFTMNSSSSGNLGQFQGAMASSSSYQQGYQKQQQQPKVTPTYYASYTKQNSSLEHILGLAPPSNLPSLTDYGSELTHDMTHSKMETGFLLNSTSVTYNGSCLVPNGNTVAAPVNSPHPLPEPHPHPPDPQTTGFYL